MSEQYPQQPASILDIRPSFLFFAFLLFFFKPYYSINGSQPVRGQWKSNVVPVPPGRYQVTVWVKYPISPQMGLSTVDVDVPNAAAAVVTWRAPLTIFTKGKIGVASVAPLDGGQGHLQQSQQQGQAQQGYQQPGYQQQPSAQPSQPQQPVASQATPASTPGGWHPDPTGRHQVRYYDGTRWTEHVGDGGSQSTDPIG